MFSQILPFFFSPGIVVHNSIGRTIHLQEVGSDELFPSDLVPQKLEYIFVGHLPVFQDGLRFYIVKPYCIRWQVVELLSLVTHKQVIICL